MTRTNKWTVHEKAGEPKWFTHQGHANQDPTKVKKEGAGNHNWGKPGDELNLDDYHIFNKLTRRNSNHELNEEKMEVVEKECEDKLL